ncbi:hypothetical protein MT418_001380 [Batrachochytrium dendrobatidis]
MYPWAKISMTKMPECQFTAPSTASANNKKPSKKTMRRAINQEKNTAQISLVKPLMTAPTASATTRVSPFTNSTIVGHNALPKKHSSEDTVSIVDVPVKPTYFTTLNSTSTIPRRASGMVLQLLAIPWTPQIIPAQVSTQPIPVAALAKSSTKTISSIDTIPRRASNMVLQLLATPWTPQIIPAQVSKQPISVAALAKSGTKTISSTKYNPIDDISLFNSGIPTKSYHLGILAPAVTADKSVLAIESTRHSVNHTIDSNLTESTSNVDSTILPHVDSCIALKPIYESRYPFSNEVICMVANAVHIRDITVLEQLARLFTIYTTGSAHSKVAARQVITTKTVATTVPNSICNPACPIQSVAVNTTRKTYSIAGPVIDLVAIVPEIPTILPVSIAKPSHIQSTTIEPFDIPLPDTASIETNATTLQIDTSLINTKDVAEAAATTLTIGNTSNTNTILDPCKNTTSKTLSYNFKDTKLDSAVDLGQQQAEVLSDENDVSKLNKAPSIKSKQPKKAVITSWWDWNLGDPIPVFPNSKTVTPIPSQRSHQTRTTIGRAKVDDIQLPAEQLHLKKPIITSKVLVTEIKSTTKASKKTAVEAGFVSAPTSKTLCNTVFGYVKPIKLKPSARLNTEIKTQTLTNNTAIPKQSDAGDSTVPNRSTDRKYSNIFGYAKPVECKSASNQYKSSRFNCQYSTISMIAQLHKVENI